MIPQVLQKQRDALEKLCDNLHKDIMPKTWPASILTLQPKALTPKP